MQTKTIGVVVLTLNAEDHLDKVLPPLVNSPLKPKVVVIDSSSHDKTQEMAHSYGVEVVIIPKSEFNHGLTREKGRKILGTDIVVFLTQDAYFLDEKALGLLIQPILEEKASVSYARQVPRPGSDLFESYAREFNYPEEGHIRSLKDVAKYGVYTFFISNSCAAYDRRALDEVGGFPDVLFGEDTAALAKILHRGKSVAYASLSKVEHSHRFTLKEEFKRNFDIGLSRRGLEKSLAIAGKDSTRGKQFATGLIKKSFETPWKTPYAFLHLAAKWLGYKLGYHSAQTSNQWKRFFSSQPYYFKQS